jgi:uncharacterized protein YukE
MASYSMSPSQAHGIASEINGLSNKLAGTLDALAQACLAYANTTEGLARDAWVGEQQKWSQQAAAVRGTAAAAGVSLTNIVDQTVLTDRQGAQIIGG